MLDTGAAASYLTREGAHKAGISSAQLDGDPVVSITAINGRSKRVRLHHVSEFVVGEDIERDVSFYVAEYLNRDDEFEMILGMDWISKHHLWLSLTTDALYIDSGEPKPANWKTAPKFEN